MSFLFKYKYKYIVLFPFKIGYIQQFYTFEREVRKRKIGKREFEKRERNEK